MRISTRGEYGLRAMVELALYQGQGPLALNVIAQRQGISEPYLEQLMGTLRKAGLVNSVRGAQGGYELSRPAAKVTVGQVLRALEGPIIPSECLTEDGEFVCVQMEECATRLLWRKLQEAIDSVVDAITLADLADEQRRLQVRSGALMYEI
ncbi:MAG: Rrf2 family transcriptional regulator [Limnochordaceae bacterium]|nr:Rrf2 family transcriptional regulator [Limnochordaceae bacterium]